MNELRELDHRVEFHKSSCIVETYDTYTINRNFTGDGNGSSTTSVSKRQDKLVFNSITLTDHPVVIHVRKGTSKKDIDHSINTFLGQLAGDDQENTK